MSNSPDFQNPDPKNPNKQNPEISNKSIDEEEGECGFCLFMKGGCCKDFFVAWESCVEEAGKNSQNIVEKCFEKTGSLKKCMEAHKDYYEPILRAEKVAEDEVKRELERDAKLKNNEMIKY